MLNELLLVQRGAEKAGIAMVQRHPDIKDTRRVPTLLLFLNTEGRIELVRPVPREAKPWTLRDGQHNSFPFIQPKRPLLSVAATDERRSKALDKKSDKRREFLLELIEASPIDATALKDLAAPGLLKRLKERRDSLASLEQTEASGFLHCIDRVRQACAQPEQAIDHFTHDIVDHLKQNLRQMTGSDWIEVSAALLLEGAGALLFDARTGGLSVFDARMIGHVSRALRPPASDESSKSSACCGLTGSSDGPLVESKFPQPNLPLLGQTYLFARNKDTPANDRYGRFSADSMPVGQETAIQLAAAAEALTAANRRGLTWRSIPGEAPKVSDLLLAFVEGLPDLPLAATLAEGETEEDWSVEESPDVAVADAMKVASFEKRAERIVQAVRAMVGDDFRQTPARIAIFRKVDPANRKVIYAGPQSVGDLYDAATEWAAGEYNVPPLTLPVLLKGERTPQALPPPHVAPLGIIAFSKKLFIRGGIDAQEALGIPASEAFALFLERGLFAQQRARRILRLVLKRRASLVVATAHAARRSFDELKKYDRREALRTVTVLGVLLNKLGRKKEQYMSETAFKLGQLLAAADVLHVGYCADVRGGDVPPSLLGNQVFTMAQSTPIKALGMLCRRWTPYQGWAKRSSREPKRVRALVKSKKETERRRGWEIVSAWRHAKQMQPLAEELGPLLAALRSENVDEVFRAELLLGYIAGLPRRKQHGELDTNEAVNDSNQEN